MYRSAIIILSTILIFLLLITGVFLFLFSPTGDEVFKPYLKRMIEEKSGLPVEIKTYKLRSGSLTLDLLLDKHLEVRTIMHYDLFSRTFQGKYHVIAKDFHYEEIVLSEADIRGKYKGVAEDIFVEGKGTALHAPVAFRLRLIDNEPQQIEATAEGIALKELLMLASQPPLANGNVDVKIDMPHIGEEGATGNAQVLLKKALFDRDLIKKHYGVVLPKTSSLSAKADASLHGKQIDFNATGNSKLFSFLLQDGSYNIENKMLKSRYDVDVKEMRLFSQNRFRGPLRVEGRIEGQGEALKITGESHSFGGVLLFEKEKKIKVSMKDLSLGKVLSFIQQPPYAVGVINADVKLDDVTLPKGSYQVALSKGRLNAKVIQKQFGYTLPQRNRLALHSSGSIDNETLKAKVKLESSLADALLEGLTYSFKSGVLETPYHLILHDVENLGKGRLPRKGKSIAVDGHLRYDKEISVNGEAKGLGKKVHFSYNGKQADLDAAGLYIEKVFALAGLPSYLKGRVDAQVKLSDPKSMTGRFSMKGKALMTQPKEMKKLLGKPVKMKLSVSAKGTMKKHKAYGDVSVKTELGNIQMKKIVSDLNKGTLTAKYHMNIPDLRKIAKISDIRLYGSLALDGVITMKKILKVTGKTGSLGGNISYRLIGNRFDTNVASVPLPNILKLTGYPQSFLGSVSGKANYNLKTRKGTANLKIASFQIKPNDLTRMLTPILKKDPSRIIFKTTTFDAKINKDIVTYRLIAKGTRSAIEITEGWVNQKSKQQRAKLKFVYGKYTVYGTIKGTTEHPKIHLDTSRIIKDKLQKKLEKKWGKEAGALLKGLGL